MSSILLPPPSSPSTSLTDTLQVLSRQFVHLQHTLQSLLDAQSIGLSAGIGQEPPTRQARPTSNSRRRDSSSRSPQPSSLASSSRSRSRGEGLHPPGLSSARRAIHSTLIQLARTKSSEVEAYNLAIGTHQRFLDNATRLEGKRGALQEEIRSLEAGSEHHEIGNLQSEEHTLSAEIQVLEEELAVKRARLREVKNERERKGNEHEARLSSWQRALEEVNNQIGAEVLEGKGLRNVKERQGIWVLPRDRRTLGLVKEEVEGLMSNLREKKVNAECEGEACVRGAESWEACALAVRHVEKALKMELVKLHRDQGTKERRDSMVSEASGSSVPEGGMQGVLQRMDDAVGKLELHLQHARDKGWNPLVCAIGAELEALRQGRDVLENAFGLSQLTLDDDTTLGEDISSSKGKEEAAKISKPVELAAQDYDGPSPDLLVSHADEE